MNTSFRMAREGFPYIIALLFLSIIIGIFNPVWAILPILLSGYVAYFFRDPVRVCPSDPLAIISAADGKVVGIDDVMETNYFQKKVKRVSIFLSIFDVHINRSPVQGNVQYIHYHS